MMTTDARTRLRVDFDRPVDRLAVEEVSDVSDNRMVEMCACSQACAACHAAILVAAATLRTSVDPAIRTEGKTLFDAELAEIQSLIAMNSKRGIHA
jgi:hypothetical protein